MLIALGVDMQSVQQIFDHPSFKHHTIAAVQRMHATERNLKNISQNFTEKWPAIRRPGCTLLILSVERGNNLKDIYAGNIINVTAATPPRCRFYVDKFIHFGVHDAALVKDKDFYGKEGQGGGSRDYVENIQGTSLPKGSSSEVQPGSDIQRLVWTRVNHHLFADAVRIHWENRCAVHDHSMNGLLVASHILPWKPSTAQQKTDPHNGLLLSASLDALFDKYLISFDNNGLILISRKLDNATIEAFGLHRDMRLRENKITEKMQNYLRDHRAVFNALSLSSAA